VTKVAPSVSFTIPYIPRNNSFNPVNGVGIDGVCSTVDCGPTLVAVLFLCRSCWDFCWFVEWVVIWLFAGVQQVTNCSLSNLKPKFEGAVFLFVDLVPVLKDLGAIGIRNVEPVGVKIC
jgi:hypothetical protein